MIRSNDDSLQDSSGTWLERHSEGRYQLPDTKTESREDANEIGATTKKEVDPGDSARHVVHVS